MPLDQDDLTKIGELINTALTTNNETLKTEFTRQITETNESLKQQIGGVMGRVKGEIKTAVGNVKTEINTDITEQLKDILPQPSQDPDNQDPSDDNDNNNEQFKQLANQIKAQTKSLEDLQQKYGEEQAARLKSEELARRSQLESQFISAVNDKVVDPRNFLQVLTSNGIILEKDGKYVVKTDKTNLDGTEIYEDATKQIDTLLAGDLKYFAKKRPGNGGGSEAGNGANGSYQSQYFGKNKITTANDIFQALKAGKGKEVMADLNQSVQNNT